MKLRKTLLTAGTIAATATAVLAGTTTASATTDPPPPGGWDYVISAPGAILYIKKHGDIFKLCDTQANNYSAQYDVGYVEDDEWHSRDWASINGLGKCVTHRASQGGRHNLPERKLTVFVEGTFSGKRVMQDFPNDR
ncbi:hypothetical protein [Amycolatopsis viridis]|uniref:Uncharacterized protein n=1 Tax=Amycolatopsis viridis TaxID=185678 RepID=A0ABX0SRA4_9PSEU|nr:hypothetical protein [Amycolatopsis viridis]NIH78457.1 hypothetical protein [Amycolatopsis viridis]